MIAAQYIITFYLSSIGFLLLVFGFLGDCFSREPVKGAKDVRTEKRSQGED